MVVLGNVSVQFPCLWNGLLNKTILDYIGFQSRNYGAGENYLSSCMAPQVKQNIEMESMEEKLHKMIIQSKIDETKDHMRRVAAKLDKDKMEKARMEKSGIYIPQVATPTDPVNGPVCMFSICTCYVFNPSKLQEHTISCSTLGASITEQKFAAYCTGRVWHGRRIRGWYGWWLRF